MLELKPRTKCSRFLQIKDGWIKYSLILVLNIFTKF